MNAVVDVSAAVRIALDQVSREHMGELDRFDQLITVDLYVPESTNAVWRYWRAGKISSDAGLELLERLMDLPDRVEGSRDFAQRALLLSVDHAHSAYDMLYLAQALRRDCALVSCDAALNRIAGRLGVPTVDLGLSS